MFITRIISISTIVRISNKQKNDENSNVFLTTVYPTSNLFVCMPENVMCIHTCVCVAITHSRYHKYPIFKNNLRTFISKSHWTLSVFNLALFMNHFVSKHSFVTSCVYYTLYREWAKDSWDYFFGLAMSSQSKETGHSLVSGYIFSDEITDVEVTIRCLIN